MSTPSSFKEALERRAGTPENVQDRSASPVVKVRLAPRKIEQPVKVARLLVEHGMSLRKAHHTINRLAEGETVAVELHADDRAQLSRKFSRLGLSVAFIELPSIDVRQIRARLALSQAEFALRFGLEISTIQNWEQGRCTPDPAAQVLLKIIETNPGVVEAVLSSEKEEAS